MSKSSNNLVTYALIGVTGLGLLIYRTRNNQPVSPGASAQGIALSQSRQSPDVPAPTLISSTNSLKLLNCNLSLSSPKDLRVKQGDTVVAGEVLADRMEERLRLTAQRQVLILSLQKIEGATMTAPPPPASVPAVSTAQAKEQAASRNSADKLQQLVEAMESGIMAYYEFQLGGVYRVTVEPVFLHSGGSVVVKLETV